MLDIAYIRNNPDTVRKAVRDKHMDADIDRLLLLDREICAASSRCDLLRGEKNKLTRKIHSAKGDREPLLCSVRDIKNRLAAEESGLSVLRGEFDALMLRVPSVPAPEVPVGSAEEDNMELRRVGSPPKFDFTPRDHVQLCELLDLADFTRAVKIAGSRSYCLKNEGALLESALCRFALDVLQSRGFTPTTVPVMVRHAAMQGTGYFPIGFDQSYKLPEDDLFLTGTSEVSLVSLYADEVFSPGELPVRLAGNSVCFRREAGTYGRDTRGLYRVHQFQKVEQVVLCEPDDEAAQALHEEILANTEQLLRLLELPYRVCLACTGELGIGQVRKHEVETWMPGRDAFCETHSCSTMGDFQARRLNIRCRNREGALRYCYTLNNTGIASPRILIPLLENHQNEDGSVSIPKALQPYMSGMRAICPKT